MSGFTWFYLGLATVFCWGVSEPGLMAGLFWLTIAVVNQLVDRLDSKGSSG